MIRFLKLISSLAWLLAALAWSAPVAAQDPGPPQGYGVALEDLNGNSGGFSSMTLTPSSGASHTGHGFWKADGKIIGFYVDQELSDYRWDAHRGRYYQTAVPYSDRYYQFTKVDSTHYSYKLVDGGQVLETGTATLHQ
jgi:uncharacterized membrane protein